MLDADAIERLTALAETKVDYVAVDVAELRTLMADHPENAAYRAWIKTNGASTGKMRIARAPGGRCCGCRLRHIQFASWCRWIMAARGDTGFAAAPAAMASHGTLEEWRA